jgi:hypothetical protein
MLEEDDLDELAGEGGRGWSSDIFAHVPERRAILSVEVRWIQDGKKKTPEMSKRVRS